MKNCPTKNLSISLLLLLFLGMLTLRAKEYDSLKGMVSQSKGKEKADILIKLSAMLNDTAPEKSFQYAYDGFKESVQSEYLKGKADARKLIGDYYMRKRNYLSALECYLSAQKIYLQIHYPVGTLETYRAIGDLSLILRDNENARIYYRKGFLLAQSIKDFRWTGIFLQELGRVEQKDGNTGHALELYDQALRSLQKVSYRTSVISIYNSIGTVYLDQGRYDEAIGFYKKLIAQVGPESKTQLGTIYTRLAHACEQKSRYADALEYNRMALKIRHEMSQMEDFNSSMINISNDYFYLNKFDSARIYMNEGIRLARANNRSYLIENAYRVMYTYYKTKGDYNTALQYFKKYQEIADSIVIEKNKGDIAILEARQRMFSMEENNKLLTRANEIQALSLKNQRFQITFLQVILIISMIIIFYSVLQYIKNLRAKREIQHIYSRMSKEMIELETTNKKISEQEHQYRFLAENSLDFITRFDKNLKRLYATPSSGKIYGYSPEEILTKSTYDLTHPDFYLYSEEKFREMMRDKTPKNFTYVARKKNGQNFWVESIMNPVFNKETGELEEFIGVTRDIQERKKKELEIMEGTAQKENLLKEIHHRVKNNFAILVSLINMQKEQSQTPELIRALTDLQLRIRTMALVHEMLYRSKDFEKISFSHYIRSLASVITGTFNRREIQLVFDVDEITLDIEAAIPLGLIVNELLTNAYRHAFPGERSGMIQVSLKTMKTPTDFTLTITDDGIGMPQGFSLDKCKTMGIQIVQILVKQLEGVINLITPPGSAFSILFSKPS